ncbi:Maelstrom domain-containing protein [Trichostrongylus colubriformis]|uniref:Maelstrom domain-containing protein n=1 Tax=Trichostrongylus colubriformis TaxID=6319 RepID=A0AAN8FB44_TRICO
MSTECGFSLYAEHLGGKLGGTRSPVCDLLYERARPAWQKLTAHEKQIWTNRAMELARLDPRRRCFDVQTNIPRNGEYVSRRRRRAEQRSEDFRRLPSVADDDIEEDEFFAVGQPINTTEDESDFLDQLLASKFEADRAMVREAILTQTDGCTEKIKELRFLIAAVQTFGNVDGMCLMAEYAMNEFNLRDGVVDRFSTLVGPWQISNDIQRNRAEFHSNETHRIPLTIGTTQYDKRQLVMEILGRCEPEIARRQGIRVGLYSDEKEDIDDRFNRLYVGDKNPHLLADEEGRRWIICLKQEYRNMLAATQHLARFPCSEQRYVLADAFLAGLADCLQGEAMTEAGSWLAALGKHLPEEFATPWERSGELFCSRHRVERNSCCATVTASRATFIILYAVEQLLK